MSRRPNPAADRAAQNQQTLKTLVKLESNKSCADCKRNKHPRWASWNLGIFVCIRCSGIHRGMGTHISRVKSVDLDSWTDEQLQSMLRWGNSRANKYWEAKLAPGHVPAEAKIENFIRTKYDSKRWVMDGPMPDPATLDAEGDDDVPLNVVQEKAKLERSTSQRASASTSRPIPAPSTKAPNIDLFGDDPLPAPQRPNTTGPSLSQPPPLKSEVAPPKQTKPADSLLGLDFFGGPPSGTSARPNTTSNTLTTNTSTASRPDLKQSILSLYASAPKSASAVQHSHSGSFSALQSPEPQQPKSAFATMNDAFGGLDLTSSPAQQQTKPSPFASLVSPRSPPSQPKSSTVSTFGSGGGFFDPAPKIPPAPQSAAHNQSNFGSSSGFGDFASLTSPQSTVLPKSAATTSSGMNDLFDLSAPSKPTEPAFKSPTTMNSAFHLSSPTTTSVSSQVSPPPTSTVPNYSGFSNMDPWGSSNAWSDSTSTVTTSTAMKSPAAVKTPATTSLSNDFGGWGSSTNTTAAPTITADDDFGGWSSAPSMQSPKLQQSHLQGQTQSQQLPKPTGGFGGDDLFSNVWQ
ncbi:ArfGap-domain-containing protein [Patellaria atrata CBS 101060]|uniref:ArfGap-domain-containing protein n=1 Tax=Patellaria atrata CBS 101060 TaxID=1346257 RepID=A0A9P4S7E3_9PEZI|nr:ArfGap-domain-containing protein [Patellaria atrata CBS 101060]